LFWNLRFWTRSKIPARNLLAAGEVNSVGADSPHADASDGCAAWTRIATSASDSDKQLGIEIFAVAALFRDYENVFTKATGPP